MSQQDDPLPKPQEKFTATEVASALRNGKGMVSVAARILGCNRETVTRYIKKYKSVEAVLSEERETFIDEAELSLRRAVLQGEPWAVALALKTIGKGRGFVEKQELAISISQIKTLTDEELEAIARDVGIS